MREVSVPQRAQGRVRPHQEGLRDSRGVKVRPLRIPEEKELQRQIEREALEQFVKDEFERRKGRCGYRRINRELRRVGIHVS